MLNLAEQTNKDVIRSLAALGELSPSYDLNSMQEYPIDTACIRYADEQGLENDWFFATLKGFDNEETARSLLRQVFPNAAFLGWRMICDRPAPGDDQDRSA